MNTYENTYQYVQIFKKAGFGVRCLVIFGNKKEAKGKIVEAFRKVYPTENVHAWKLEEAHYYNNNYKRDAQTLVSRGLFV